MSVSRPHEPSGLPLIPALNLSSPIYPPNREDESPINESVSSPSRVPRANDVNVLAHQKQRRPNLIIQVVFWTLVVLFLIGIGYYLNDNSTQVKEIDEIIMNVETTQNAETSKIKEPQLQMQANMTVLNPSESNKAITEKQIFERTGEEEKQQTISTTNHQQIKLKSYLFDQIPKRVWHFSPKSPQKSSLWTQKTLQQHKRMSLGIQYQFLTINPHNYGKYLPLSRFKMIKNLIQIIDTRYKAREEPQLIRFRDLLVEQLITVQILVQNGGIFIQKDIILTEDVRWINKITDNPYVNAKEFLKKPIFIAFHSVEFSSQMEYYEALPNKILAERYIVRYPSIQSYFMACNKNNLFLTSLRDNFHKLVQEPSTIKKYISDYGMNIPGMQHKISFYESIFHVACQMALRIKEKELPEKSQIISHFQLATINQNFGPTKIKAYLSTEPADKIFSHLGRFSRKQLQYEFGPIRYMLHLEPIQEMYVQLRQFAQNEKIIQTSLIHETLFNPSLDASIKMQVVRPEVLGGQKWTTLPSKLWIYCRQQTYKTKLFNQIWIQNTQKIAQQSKYQLVILNETNLAQYISKETIKRIDDATNKKHAKLNVQKQTRIELISLAVLHEHGGVWVSQQTFLLDNLDWLRNINNEPYIWNKNGRTPKVVLTFQPHYGSPFQWKYNKEGIKQTWHLAYQVSFIAAVPKAELINDWFNEIISDLGTPIQDLFSRFYNCQISHHLWIGDVNHEMLSHDCIKCVLGAKKKQLSEEANPMSPNEYYGLWAINGYAGYLKMRQYTSFLSRRTMENAMIWRYPFTQMQNLAGKVNHFTRIYSYSAQGIQKLYNATNKENIDKQFHKDSFFIKLLAKINETIVLAGNGLVLQSHYLKLQSEAKAIEEKMRLSLMPQLIWIYLGGQIDGNDTFVKKNLFQNIEHYANQSKYQVRYITRENYGTWLKEQKENVDNFVKGLKQKSGKQKSNLKDHYENIIGQYISLSLLYQFGGIAITKKLVFHENLSWVKNPQKIKFLNKGGNSEAKVLGFFGPGYSSKRVINKNNNEEFVMFPSVQNYFIASGKRSTFIKDFLVEFKDTVMSHDKCKKRMEQIGHESGWLHGNDPYYEAFFLTSQFVISKKQKWLEENKSKQNALDYYGLYSLNTRYYPYKLHNFINSLKINQQNFYQYLAKTPLAEIEKEIGPLRYLSIIPRFNQIKEYISKSISGQKGFEILQRSFLHKNLILNSQKNGIIKYEQPKTKQGNKEWSTLPQDVWIYIPKGVKSSELTIQLMFIQLNVTLSEAGFKIHQITDENINKSLDQETVKRIKKVTSQKNSQVHAESLLKLALLQKYGGISIPSNMLLTEKPSWIKSISTLSSELTFNKFGDHPKVLMFVDTLRHTSKWNYNQGSKVGHFIGWQDDFIAAEKDNELIKQWASLFFEYLQADSKKQAQIFEGCQLKDKKRSKSNSKELSQDILQCVLNKKKNTLQKQKDKKQVCNYYGLWGISGYLGPLKLESQLSLDQIENDLNPFLWKWSEHQTQLLIGKIQFMAQLQTNQLSLVGKLIETNQLKQWGKKDSLLTRTLYSSTVEKLKIKDGKVVMKE